MASKTEEVIGLASAPTEITDQMNSKCSLVDSGTALESKPSGSSLPTPEIIAQRYTYLKLIGEGATGKTYKAYDKLKGTTVAIKALRKQVDFKTRELFDREAATLKSIDVKGVPKFIDIVAALGNPEEVYLVQEFINGEPLIDWINERANDLGAREKEIEVRKFIEDLAHILDDLQTKYTPPIIHRDIKPSNILYDKSVNQYYLVDFGSVTNPQRKSMNSTIAGTQGYMAPEQLLGDATIQSDFYGLGATVLHMITGISPADMPSDGFTRLYDTYIDAIDLSDELKSLIKQLIAPRAADRPRSASDILARLAPSSPQPNEVGYMDAQNVDDYPLFPTLIHDTIGDTWARAWMRRSKSSPWLNVLLFVPMLLWIVLIYVFNAVISYFTYLIGIREINKDQYSMRERFGVRNDKRQSIVQSGNLYAEYNINRIKRCSALLLIAYFPLILVPSFKLFVMVIKPSIDRYFYDSTIGIVLIFASMMILLAINLAILFSIGNMCDLSESTANDFITERLLKRNHQFQFRHTLHRYCCIPDLFLPKYFDDDSDLKDHIRDDIGDSIVVKAKIADIYTSRSQNLVHICLTYNNEGKAYALTLALQDAHRKYIEKSFDQVNEWNRKHNNGESNPYNALIGKQIDCKVCPGRMDIFELLPDQTDTFIQYNAPDLLNALHGYSI